MPTNKSSRPKSKSEKPKARSKRKRKTNPGSKKDWNILFYLIGDGLISSSMISQLKAITDAGFEENTNVLVYFDPNCNGKNARIFEVNAKRKENYENKKTHKKTIIGDGLNSFVRDIAEDCHIASLPQIPAEITLRYFLEYARAYYPAKNYLLFLMGHGVIVGNDAFLPDPDDNSAITLPDLGWILRTFADKVRADGDEFPLVGFHSCSMSSAELAFELAGSAQYMIGTQGAAFPGSWPYRQLLKKIFNAIDESRDHKSTLEKKVVGTILDALQNLSFYNSEDFWLAGFSSDISLCSLEPEQVKRMKEPIEELSRALQRGIMDPVAKDSIRLAHLESQSYWQENYTDIYDFCSCLSERCWRKNGIEDTIRKACKEVMSAINAPKVTNNGKASSNGFKSTDLSQKLVVYSDFYGPAYQFSNGLSIYFPWRSPANQVIETYRGYKFTQELGSSSWLNFLQKYFRKTQREARSTRTPWRSSPDMSNLIPFTLKTNLLRTLSDQGILALGPPPAKVGGGLSNVGGEFSKVGRDLSKLGGDLLKVGGNLSGKVRSDLSKVGGNLSKVGGNLSKVGGDLSAVDGKLTGKVGAELSGKVAAELSKAGAAVSRVLKVLSNIEGELDKVGAELSSDEGVELSKLFGELWKVGGDLSKVGGELSGKVGGSLSNVRAELSEKVGGNLSKVGAELSKVGAELSKVGGNLSSNEGSELTKVGAELSKVGGNLGALYGHTVIKNFSSPEYQFVTSRPDRADLNLFERSTEHTRPEASQTKHRANKRPNPAKGTKK